MYTYFQPTSEGQKDATLVISSNATGMTLSDNPSSGTRGGERDVGNVPLGGAGALPPDGSESEQAWCKNATENDLSTTITIKAVTNNGNWFDGSTWNTEKVPVSTDVVFIPPNITVPDDGSEPSKTTWIWLSPDIWVRNQDDNSMAYQNVMYGQDNWVYVRARNRGALPMQNTKVEVYRSGASMGSSWPRGWQLVGTSTVAEFAPGATETVHIKWEKDKIANPGHYCFYARLLNDQDPMFVAETNDMVGNAFRNNNIAWRNFNVVGLLTQATDKFKVAVGNPTDAKVTMKLVFDERE